MSKTKVEENAVIEVRNMMKKSDKIMTKDIKEGDKGQSTDGFLSIYFDNPDKKEYFINFNKIKTGNIHIKMKTIHYKI